MKSYINYYVYSHINKENNEIFYIGIGSTVNENEYKRSNTKFHRNNFWKNYTNKYSYKVEILYENINKKSAIDFEIFLIKLYGRRDLNEGTLVNLTDGGEGIKRYKHTKETKNKMSKSHLGKVMSKKTKQKLSNFRKDIPSNRCKPVIDNKTGVIYNSLKEACKHYDFKYRTLHAMLIGQNPNKSNLTYIKKNGN